MKRAKVACLRIPVVQAHPGKRQTPRTVQKKGREKKISLRLSYGEGAS
jgi:hypothetical protein